MSALTRNRGGAMHANLPSMAVPLLSPRLPTLDRLSPYLGRIDASGWYSNFGPLVQELEKRIADAFHRPGTATPRAVTVGNGTVGIELALRALHTAYGLDAVEEKA